MPNSVGSRDARQPAAPPASSVAGPRGGGDPLRVALWLEEKRGAIASRWLAELRARGVHEQGALWEILEEFIDLLTAALPGMLGPFKEQVEPLWHQAAELYGNAGALRGLASGEAIKKFQILREVLIRQAFRDPPGRDLREIGFREVLVLNRIIDAGVAFAGVGHTDSLFFALFQGAGVSDSPTPEVTEELRGQVTAIRAELDRLRFPKTS